MRTVSLRVKVSLNGMKSNGSPMIRVNRHFRWKPPHSAIALSRFFGMPLAPIPQMHDTKQGKRANIQKRRFGILFSIKASY